MMPRALNTGSSKNLARLRLASWAYTAGYFAYGVIAGIKMWPTTTWPQWYVGRPIFQSAGEHGRTLGDDLLTPLAVNPDLAIIREVRENYKNRDKC
jgi:hypothetical protein